MLVQFASIRSVADSSWENYYGQYLRLGTVHLKGCIRESEQVGCHQHQCFQATARRCKTHIRINLAHSLLPHLLHSHYSGDKDVWEKVYLLI